MKPFFPFSFFFFLTSAALVMLARWLHPAVFSSLVPGLLFTAAVAVAAIHLWRHE